MQFLEDGTFITTTDGSVVTGKYHLAHNGRIVFEIDNAAGPVPSVLEYTITGDELTFLDPAGVKTVFRREP